MPTPNILALIVGTLIPMVMGFIYYHPKVMGTAWMKSKGLTQEDLKKGNMAVVFGLSLVMSLFLSWYLLYDVDGPGQEGAFDSFKHGAFHGFLIGLLVAVPVLVTNGLFERNSMKNLAINTVYWLITISLMGGAIDALNHWPADLVLPG